MAHKGEKLYEGKAKILYQTDDPTRLIQYFKDDATAFNAQKRGLINNKGVMNNHISSIIFQFLTKEGIPNHYCERVSDREMLIKRCEIVPIEIVQRNLIAGSLAKRMGLEEGTALPFPLLEYYYKNDALGDPMVNRDHARAFQLATEDELQVIDAIARRVNTFLTKYFDGLGILLVDFKLEFGRFRGGAKPEILLADEITPDGCRLWDKSTHEKLDKDRFRHNLGRVEEAYQRVYRLVCASMS
ncbi:MAG: phosphoribosylaminoimidazolesuccinocarboxamide synthase [Deltaproteobacteria bacterium]|nr:phosphoribosylaminoimidazolesuccinocarboxamide synthase [Deltaproteobacteria bacterium]